jgi:hypothetical protein
MTIWSLGFHFEIREIARGVTAMVVGSGALLALNPVAKNQLVESNVACATSEKPS